MRMSHLVGRTMREDPRDATCPSHRFLIRGGYARQVSAGIFSLLPLGKRVVAKIEAIVRQEMDALGAQEVLMPVVLPAELWEESGRYQNVGPELLRFRDRNDKNMLLAMTHEEAVVHLARTEINSYKQLPATLYQIQTKYRDEARPRAGLIRVREFTMKDAYSFHASWECLDEFYEKAREAYIRIFERVGLDNCLCIESDPGMMGGDVAHEFIAVADCGEDVVFVSPDASYKANREVAMAAWKYEKSDPLPLEKVPTPGKQSIEEVAGFLGVGPENTGKAVFYTDSDGNLVFAMIRGDFDVNESKLRKILGVAELAYADDEAIKAAGAEPGFASPMGLDPEKVKIVVDNSIAGSSNLVVGANEKDFHYKNFNLDRDLPDVETVDIALVRDGDPCPLTGAPLKALRGIEVGNIFKLGVKYSEPMNCRFLDSNGKSHPMIMGCYGLGVGRAMAAVVEQSHDEWGPIWPLSIAPFHVHICALDPAKTGVRETADQVYEALTAEGVETIYDDRGAKAGAMFSDADLVGAPLRIIISPKTLADGEVELKKRGEKEGERIPLDALIYVVKTRLNGASDPRK